MEKNDGFEFRIITCGSQLRRIRPYLFKDYLNALVREGTFLDAEKPVTLSERKAWMCSKAKEIDHGEVIKVLLFKDGELIGDASATREKRKQRHNVSFGLSIAKDYRGKGLGEALFLKTIEVAKKRLKPHKMWVHVTAKNKVALSLYRKCGFRPVARLKEYVFQDGHFCDKIIMEFKTK